MLRVALEALGYVFVYLLMAVPGFIFRKYHKITDEGNHCLSFILSWLLQPMLVLNTFIGKTYSPEALPDILNCIWVSILVMVILTVVSVVAYKVIFPRDDVKVRSAYAMSSTFMNCGFLGIPLIDMLMPGDSMAGLYCAIFVMIFNIFFWTVGVYSITRDKQYISFKSLLNPTYVAIAIGFVLFFTGVSDDFPLWLSSGVGRVAGMSAPVCMIILGVRIADAKFKDLFCGTRLWLGVVIKLLVGPMLAIGALILLGVDLTMIKTLLILVAMPTASLCMVLAQMYGGDSDACLKVQLASTILCIVSIPLLWGLLELLIQNGVV